MAAMLLIPDGATVTVLDPDEPFGSPAYDGPVELAAERLEPGRYPATVTSTDPAFDVVLLVGPLDSVLVLPSDG